MFRQLFILSFILAFANAKITLQEINIKPPCRAKNFMIWQYLNQNISPSQADKAFYQLDGVSNKLLFAYAKKCNKHEIKETVSCMKQKDLLSIKNKECLELAISPFKTLKMTNTQRDKLAKKIDLKSTKTVLKIQNEPYLQKAYEAYKPGDFLTFFNNTSKTFRRKNLNIFLNKNFINKLSSHWKISKFIKIVVNDDKLNKLQLSLLSMDSNKLNSQNNFFLALNQIKHSREKEALKFLNRSLFKAKRTINKDKNYFWMYKITRNKKYFNKLLSSMSINIYTIYAHELANKDFNNYFTSLKTIDEKNKRNLSNPFDWDIILKEIKATPNKELLNLASSYSQKNMIPVQSLIIEKAHNYKEHGYMMPYDIYLKDISINDKALIYAIMRQESSLIPSAISRSYALGLMQLMPFVVDAISKNSKKPLGNYRKMFIPKNNINYALKHINWMKKSLYHPLFIAYAYNGGMGFLKRHLKDGAFKKGKYEPYLSMELMSNSQSREYGKKVLANYVMYKRIMGENISIIHLFDILTQPKKTDRFREQG